MSATAAPADHRASTRQHPARWSSCRHDDPTPSTTRSAVAVKSSAPEPAGCFGVSSASSPLLAAALKVRVAAKCNQGELSLPE
ncbi:hypothetical protein ACRAWF_11145 [Streptomyces sp. L7]